MNQMIGCFRDNVLLGQHLDAIGHRLKDAEGPHSVGAVAILNPSKHFSLQECHHCEKPAKGRKDRHRRQGSRHQGPQTLGRLEHQACFDGNEKLFKPHVSGCLFG